MVACPCHDPSLTPLWAWQLDSGHPKAALTPDTFQSCLVALELEGRYYSTSPHPPGIPAGTWPIRFQLRTDSLPARQTLHGRIRSSRLPLSSALRADDH